MSELRNGLRIFWFLILWALFAPALDEEDDHGAV